MVSSHLRVCVATTVFPRWPGHGEGTFIWQFIKVLRQQQIEVTVVAMHSPGLPTRDNWEGVEILRPPYWWPAGAEMLRKDGGGLPINFRRYRLARIQLPALLLAHGAAIVRAARGCDLIHAHFTVSAAAALAMQTWHRLPVVVTVHGSDIFQVPKLPLGATFTRNTLRRSAAVTTVSTALCDACLALGVPAAQLRVVSNSVDMVAYTPAHHSTFKEREPVVLFVGSLITRKGVDTLVRSMAGVLQVLPGYRLVVVGEGPEQENLTAIAVRLGIAPAIEFPGFLSQAGVAALDAARTLVCAALERRGPGCGPAGGNGQRHAGGGQQCRWHPGSDG